MNKKNIVIPLLAASMAMATPTFASEVIPEYYAGAENFADGIAKGNPFRAEENKDNLEDSESKLKDINSNKGNDNTDAGLFGILGGISRSDGYSVGYSKDGVNYGHSEGFAGNGVARDEDSATHGGYDFPDEIIDKEYVLDLMKNRDFLDEYLETKRDLLETNTYLQGIMDEMRKQEPEMREYMEDMAMENNQEPSTLTVSASASIYTVPDKASFQVKSEATEEDSEKAMRECAKKMIVIMEMLHSSGISKEDIHVSSIGVYPEYDYENGNGTDIIGYKAYYAIKINNLDVADAGDLMKACIEEGADEVNSLEYYISNYDELYRDALKEAIVDAKKKAAVIAEADGMELGRIKAVSEWQQDSYGNDLALYKSESAMNAGGDWNISIAGGQMEVKAQVTAIFEAN